MIAFNVNLLAGGGDSEELPPENTRIVAKVNNSRFCATKKNGDPCHPYLLLLCSFPRFTAGGRARVQVPIKNSPHCGLHQKILASVINAFNIEKESVGAFLAEIKEMPVEDQQEQFLAAIGEAITGRYASCKVRHDEWAGVVRAECQYFDSLDADLAAQVGADSHPVELALKKQQSESFGSRA